MTLWGDFLGHTGRGVSKWKHYFPAYQRHLARYVDRPVFLFEIGVSGGGSLQLWKKFLGPYARIVGIDTNLDCKFGEDQISVRIGSQTDTEFLQSILDEFGVPDIIIDDGSHVASHQVASFHYLYPRMDRAGVYAVEDLHASYWEHAEGGLRRPGTFIEVSKSLIDQLHGRYTDASELTAFTDTTLSICFYDSLVIFERGELTNRTAPQIDGGKKRPDIVYQDHRLRQLDEGEIPKQR
jgi:hypothetical protein